MFGRFEVRFLAKITCSDMFEVRFWWFWKILGPFFINKVREQFGFWWCSRGSKFGFGPKWDVRMCSKFDPLRFGMLEVRFFDVRSTSNFWPFHIPTISSRRILLSILSSFLIIVVEFFHPLFCKVVDRIQVLMTIDDQPFCPKPFGLLLYK